MRDDETRAGFIEFIGRAPAAQHPGVLFEGFRADLVGRGIPEDDAARQMQRVMELSRERHDWAGPMFDRIYTSDAPQFRSEPNAFLVRVCAGRLPGRALDIAMGQGRNAVHLARSGWQVTGFDVSAAGLAVAEQAAAAADTRIEAVLCASDEFDYGTAAWDLMVASYAVVPITSPEFARTVTEALRPGWAVRGRELRRP